MASKLTTKLLNFWVENHVVSGLSRMPRGGGRYVCIDTEGSYCQPKQSHCVERSNRREKQSSIYEEQCGDHTFLPGLYTHRQLAKS